MSQTKTIDKTFDHYQTGTLQKCPNLSCGCQDLKRVEFSPEPPLPDNPISAPVVSFIRRVKKGFWETKEKVESAVKKKLGIGS